MNCIRRPQQVCVAPPRVNVICRPIYHDVLHVQPYHTHIINQRINCHRHVNTFSCSSEYQCKDIQAGRGRC